MNKAIYAVYGASGFGCEVMPLLRRQLQRQSISSDQIVFIDDGLEIDMLNGHKVVTYNEFMMLPASERMVTIAIADSIIREKLTMRCESDGLSLYPVVAENVMIMDQVQQGDGGILAPFVTITSNVKIGKSFQANLYSYVAHDCVIGDYVTFAPSVKCNGNVVVEDHVYIGTGAIIKQGKCGRPLKIGKGAIVGMGAVVTKNVPAGKTVIGNPARLLSKENLKG